MKTLFETAGGISVTYHTASDVPAFELVSPPDYGAMDALTASLYRTDNPVVCRINGAPFTLTMLRRRKAYRHTMPAEAEALLKQHP